MRSRKELEKELVRIKTELRSITDAKLSERNIIAAKVESDKTSSNMFTLVKYMFDENRRTTLLLKSISESVARLESELHDLYYEEEAEPEDRQSGVTGGMKEIPISGLDRQIVQTVQVKGMVCADDIKEVMKYKGRNAASAHLNRLYRAGILHRYQLGRKVYFKYDTGKTADTLIVSPPQ